jgi:hypothetical protein
LWHEAVDPGCPLNCRYGVESGFCAEESLIGAIIIGAADSSEE